jgi:hypothetical protein
MKPAVIHEMYPKNTLSFFCIFPSVPSWNICDKYKKSSQTVSTIGSSIVAHLLMIFKSDVTIVEFTCSLIMGSMSP